MAKGIKCIYDRCDRFAVYYNNIEEVKRRVYYFDKLLTWNLNGKVKYMIYDRNDRLIAQFEEYEKKPRKYNKELKDRDFSYRRRYLKYLKDGSGKLVIKNDNDYYGAKMALEQWALIEPSVESLLETLIENKGEYTVEILKRGNNPKYLVGIKPSNLL